MAPNNTNIGNFYYQVLGGDGKPIVSIGDNGIKCATFEPDTFLYPYEYCVVKDVEQTYSGYRSFIRKYCENRENDWFAGELPKKDRIYKIIKKAPHEDDSDLTLYVIEDMDTEQIYVIHEDGIEKFNYNWGLSNISVDACDAMTYSTFVNEGFTINKKGEMEMKNEVLELYAKREKEKIANTFKKIKEEEYNNIEAIKRYNELVNTFKASLAELVEEYRNEDDKIFIKTVYENNFEYEINPYLEAQISDKYRKDYDLEIKELNDRVEEIRAVLSLSDDVEYQTKVLIEYGILNKKGVMVNE